VISLVLCRRFAKQYEVVADSWTSLDKHGRLYLSVLEYRNGQEVFAKVAFFFFPF